MTLLREIAVAYDWQGVTLWVMPFRTLAVDAAIRGLEAIHPHYEYVHAKTGERRADQPEDYAKAVLAQARAVEMTGKTDVPLKTHWQRVDLWETRENTFVGVLPLLVDVEFPERQSAEVRAFRAAVWELRDRPLAERWDAFRAVIGTATSNALWDAYLATRDTSFEPSEDAAAQSDPLPDSDDTPTTSGSSPD